MSKKLRFFSELLARFINGIEYKIVLKKLKKHDLMADIDDQRSHHYYSQQKGLNWTISINLLLFKKLILARSLILNLIFYISYK